MVNFLTILQWVIVTATMDGDKTVARPRATQVDENVAMAKQMIQTTEKLKKVKDVMSEMLEGIQHDRSSHNHTQKVQI
jgi:hypothetical protein